MTKNMTRKGLAFGAGLALVASGVAALPATADGLYVANYVSLLPNAGTAYSTLSSETFDLRSNVVGSLQGTSDKNLKFLVTDPDRLLAIDVDTNSLAAATEVVVADAAVISIVSTAKAGSQNQVVFTVTAHGFENGDSIEVTAAATDGVPTGIYEVSAVATDTFQINSGNATALTQGSLAIKTASPQKTGTAVTLHKRAHGLVVGDAVNVTTAAAAGLAVGVYTVASVPSVNRFTVTAADSTALTLGTRPIVKFGDQGNLDSQELLAKVTKISSTGQFGTASIPTTIGGVSLTDGRKADGSFVVDTETNSNSSNRTLRLVNTDSTKSTVVTVTAWVDDNDDNIIDSTEYVSLTRTVNFYKTSDLTVTTALVTPVIGDATLSGTISISPALNGAQIRTAATAGVYVVPTIQAGSATVTSVTWNATNSNWDFVITDDNNVEVGTFTARAEIADAATGNTATVLVSTRTAADTNISAVATGSQTAADNKTASTPSSVTVREDAKASLVITAFGADQDTAGAKIVAGIPVNVVFSNATNTTDWTVNGVKVLDNATAVTKVYTTDSNGQVALEVSSASGLGAVTIEAQPQGLTTTTASKVTLTWAEAVYDLVDLNAPAKGSARNVVEGGSVSFDIAALDQWGQLMSGNYQLKMVLSGESDGTNLVGFSSGRVTYTVAHENLDSSNAIGVTTQLQKMNVAGTAYVNSTDATDLSDVTVTVVASPVTSIVVATTYSSGTTFDLTLKQIVAYNAELGFNALTTLDTDNASIALTAGTGIAVGDTVTVSGAGMWFSYKDGGAVKVLAKDTMTFVLDNTADTIGVHSNVYAKDAVVTVTSQGRSATTKVTTAVAQPDTGTAINIAAPASVLPGSTFQVTGTLTDAFGNVVNATAGDLIVSYAGPGIVFGDLPTDTDANGEFKFAVLLGTNDSGTATITASYDLDGDGVLTDDVKNFTVSASVLVGANASDLSAWTSLKPDNQVKVYAKNVIGAGKVQIRVNGKEIAWTRAMSATNVDGASLRNAGGAYYLVRTVTLSKGSKTAIEVFVDGKRVSRTAYTGK